VPITAFWAKLQSHQNSRTFGSRSNTSSSNSYSPKLHPKNVQNHNLINEKPTPSQPKKVSSDQKPEAQRTRSVIRPIDLVPMIPVTDKHTLMLMLRGTGIFNEKGLAELRVKLSDKFLLLHMLESACIMGFWQKASSKENSPGGIEENIKPAYGKTMKFSSGNMTPAECETRFEYARKNMIELAKWILRPFPVNEPELHRYSELKLRRH